MRLLKGEKIKVVHVIGALVAGGAERFVVGLLLEMKKHDYDIRLLVLSSKMDEAGIAMRQDLESQGIPFVLGPTDRVAYRTIAWYIRRLWAERPMIIHLHTANTELMHYIGRFAYRRTHFIVRTLHSTKLPDSPVMRYAIKHNPASISIACSQAAAETGKALVRGQITCIPNGISFSWPIQTFENSTLSKNKLGLFTDVMHFLCVGRMSGESVEHSPKAHEILVKAWRQAKLGERDCELHLLGEGSLRGELMGLARGDQSIIFHGVQSNIPDWLLASDCFVMVSRWEGLPISGIEAVGSGLPCIFSDIPQLRELEPEAVIWVTRDDIDALAAALKRFQAHPVFPPTSRDTERARRKFSITNTVKNYMSVYKKLINQ
jgi:glycosyltransferase involved in cell wall biosynthesis